jgi:hypothetical protein
MKTVSFERYFRMSFPLVSSLGLLAFALSCGKSSEESKDKAASTPTPVPTATDIPETPPVAFWMAGNSTGGPVVVRFDSAGRQSLVIDLFSFGIDRGPITAMHFLDSSTLLLVVSPSETTEKSFVTLDIKSGLVKNKAWGLESAIRDAFKPSDVLSLVTGFQASFLHLQTKDAIKKIRYGADGGLSVADFFSKDPANVNCPSDVMTGAALVQGGGSSQIISLSTGTVPRLNVLSLAGASSPCKYFDYSSGITTADHKPVNILQTADGKVYALFQHVTAPKIIRYDYDGAELKNPIKFFDDKGDLSVKPFGLIARTNRKIIVGNSVDKQLIEIEIKGDEGFVTEFFQKSSFITDNGTALVAEPAQ